MSERFEDLPAKLPQNSEPLMFDLLSLAQQRKLTDPYALEWQKGDTLKLQNREASAPGKEIPDEGKKGFEKLAKALESSVFLTKTECDMAKKALACLFSDDLSSLRALNKQLRVMPDEFVNVYTALGKVLSPYGIRVTAQHEIRNGSSATIDFSGFNFFHYDVRLDTEGNATGTDRVSYPWRRGGTSRRYVSEDSAKTHLSSLHKHVLEKTKGR